MSEKSAEQLYNERDARAFWLPRAASSLDQIPVFGPFQKYPYHFAGITCKEAMNDYAGGACRPATSSWTTSSPTSTSARFSPIRPR